LIEIKRFNERIGDKIKSVLCPGLGTLTGAISPEACAIQMKYAYDSILNNAIKFPDDLTEACISNKRLFGNLI
jgi:hypothetical protein